MNILNIFLDFNNENYINNFSNFIWIDNSNIFNILDSFSKKAWIEFEIYEKIIIMIKLITIKQLIDEKNIIHIKNIFNNYDDIKFQIRNLLNYINYENDLSNKYLNQELNDIINFLDQYK